MRARTLPTGVALTTPIPWCPLATEPCPPSTLYLTTSEQTTHARAVWAMWAKLPSGT